MFKAQQRVLLQQTNQAVLDIRQSEIDYFVNINSNCGTQAALIGGFIYAVFSEITIGTNDIVSDLTIALTVYYVLSSIALAFSLHVIICSMLLQVLGPGLALNGPIGSMARAVEGLRSEQSHVIQAFILMIVFFTLSTVVSFWVSFDFPGAIASTVVFLVGMRVYFVTTHRIRWRFHWDPALNNANATRDSEDPANFILPTDNRRGVDPSNQNRFPPTAPFLNYLFGGKLQNTKRQSTELDATISPISSNTSSAAQRTTMVNQSADSKAIVMEGYVGMRGFLVGESKKEKWERRYLTITTNGNMFYYLSRIKYRSDPIANRINSRPVQIGNYSVSFPSPSQCGLPTDTSAPSSAVENLVILLAPREEEVLRHWQLRTDTEEELDLWRDALTEICKRFE